MTTVITDRPHLATVFRSVLRCGVVEGMSFVQTAVLRKSSLAYPRSFPFSFVLLSLITLYSQVAFLRERSFVLMPFQVSQALVL